MCVSVSAEPRLHSPLVSAAKVMRCIQCCLVSTCASLMNLRDLHMTVVSLLLKLYLSIVVNVSHGQSKWSASVQFKRSKVKVTGRQKLQEIAAYLAWRTC